MGIPSTEDAATLLRNLGDQLEVHEPQARALRRELHRHPDLSGAERPTAERLRRDLPPLKAIRVADTGFLTRLGPPGPAVMVRAELDALPIRETTAVDWSATGDVMHACGHDVHLAALWALMQAARRVSLPVGFLALFQPREETQPSGAQSVVESGVLDDAHVRAVIGAHVQPRVAPGVVSTGAGAVNASADEFTVTVIGQPGHGAYPHIAIDPIPILAAVVTGLQELVARTIDPTHPAVITVGRMKAGTAANVIASQGRLTGVIRTMYPADRTHLHHAITALAEHTAAARGARAEVKIVVGDPILVNDPDLVALTDPLLKQLGLPVAHQPFRSCGADDFSHYGDVAPSVMMFIGVSNDPAVDEQADTYDTRAQVGLHHPHFLPSEDSVGQVARAMAAGLVAGMQLAGRQQG